MENKKQQIIDMMKADEELGLYEEQKQHIEFINANIEEFDKAIELFKQERSYSEEEAFNLLMEFSSRDRNSSSGTPHSIAKWFEQFKKK